MANNVDRPENLTRAQSQGHSRAPSRFHSTGSHSSANGQRPSSIDEALRMLDEALAGQGAANLQELISNDYKNVKSALEEARPVFSASLRSLSDETMSRVSDVTSRLTTVGMERGREALRNIDHQVRSSPWPIIGGVAVGAFALGLILGRGGSSETMKH